MRIDGNCIAGGPLNIRGIPIPVDPTLRRVRPEPPRPIAPAPVIAPPQRVDIRPRRPAVTDDIREAVRRDREAGDSAAAIAVRYGIHRVTVYKICQGAA